MFDVVLVMVVIWLLNDFMVWFLWGWCVLDVVECFFVGGVLCGWYCVGGYVQWYIFWYGYWVCVVIGQLEMCGGMVELLCEFWLQCGVFVGFWIEVLVYVVVG